MKKITYLIFLLLFLIKFDYSLAQCTNSFQWPDETITSNNSGIAQLISSENYAGDYAVIDGLIITGNYEFTSSAGDFITVTDDLDNVLDSGFSPLVITGMPYSIIRVHFNLDAACNTDSMERTTRIRCLTCAIPPASSCFSIDQYPVDPVVLNNDGSVETIETCNYAGEYAVLNGLTLGKDYEFTSNGGDNITITDTSNNVIAFGYSPLTVSSIGYTEVRVHFHVTGNCETESNCRITTVQCTTCLLSVNELSQEDLFIYYPNPVNNLLNIKSQKNIESIIVYDILGQQVIIASPNSLNHEFDTTTLTTGSYFVKVTAEGISKTVRIVKQ